MEQKNNYGYITDYYNAINNGDVIVGKLIKQIYTKIIKELDDGKCVYDKKKANKAIRFIENFCRHSEGNLGGQLIHLELWQKALLSIMFGVLDKDGWRQYREVVLIIGRKNGKTALASAIACYQAYADGEYGGNIYIVATKLQQANICYNGCYQMIQKENELSRLAKKRRSDIYLPSTNTTIQPIAFSEKKSDGLNPSLCICDELASWSGVQGIKQYEVLKSALGARKQPIVLNISTAGFENDGIFDELMGRCLKVINGESKEKRLLPIIYQIDDPLKWNDINELKKANPNMNVSVSEDFFLDEIDVATDSYSKKTEFLCKYCNIKQNSSVAWLSAEDIKNAFNDEALSLEQYKNNYAVCGIDLSQTTDLTSACVVIEKDNVLNVISHFWLPSARLEIATQDEGIPYQKYIDKGWLSLSGDNIIDYRDIYQWIYALVREYKIMPLVVGYDRYSSNYLIEDLKQAGFRCESIIQGPNLSSSISEVEGRLKDKTINCGNNTLMKIHLLNTALKTSNDGKSQIVKIAKRGHIDGTAALLDAIAVRRYYPEYKKQLQNIR